ncbi:MAG: hypothetical protein HQK91_08470 [Nitrospirae bacterium]|nr:hypothetical protein [Nitrospirota bacterium]MBF0541467.1 hypothetical protein [Nitrospirota bacterium]
MEKVVFHRDGAKYLCAVCKAKYFTRDEVTACFNSHESGGAAAPEPEPPEETSAAPEPTPAPAPPSNPSMLVKLELKQEYIDKINALAAKHNTKPAKIIEKLVEKAFIPPAK